MLTAKKLKFISAYMGAAAGNGQKAAEMAGYAKGSAKVTACRLLKEPAIKAAIANKQQKFANQSEIALKRVLDELAVVAFSDVRSLFTDTGRLRDIHTLEEPVARAIASVEVAKQRIHKDGDAVTEEWVTKVKQWDKLRALELVAKLRGFFPADKVEHVGAMVPLFALPAGAIPDVSPKK